jgi:hypothetical protein
MPDRAVTSARVEPRDTRVPEPDCATGLRPFSWSYDHMFRRKASFALCVGPPAPSHRCARDAAAPSSRRTDREADHAGPLLRAERVDIAAQREANEGA